MFGLFTLILLSITSAFALDAITMADKISTILNSNCIKSLSPDESTAEIVYLRGSPVDSGNAPQAGQKLLDIANILGKQRGHVIKSKAIHHTKWSSACEQLQQSSAKYIYLVGHSYGAAGAMKIANCLQEKHKNISFLSTISSYDLLSGVDVTKIPANVVNHFNYFTTDASMPGYDNHKAIDSDHTFVRNVLAEQESSFPHLNVAEDIVALITLQIFADLEAKAERTVIPNIFNANFADKNFNQFGVCN
jgi:hypothetical protein